MVAPPGATVNNLPQGPQPYLSAELQSVHCAAYLIFVAAIAILAALLRRWRRAMVAGSPSRQPVVDRGPARPPDSRQYDIFLSHRGPDVKTHFVAFLEEALGRAGVHSFVDRTALKQGDPAWATMKQKLDTAEIVMPVFSSGYVESTWCLDELELMMRNPAKVMPIFYDACPGLAKLEKDVRRCTGFSSAMLACMLSSRCQNSRTIRFPICDSSVSCYLTNILCVQTASRQAGKACSVAWRPQGSSGDHGPVRGRAEHVSHSGPWPAPTLVVRGIKLASMKLDHDVTASTQVHICTSMDIHPEDFDAGGCQ